jgi:EmrB/QacA subfamily drug resistance transporter
VVICGGFNLPQLDMMIINVAFPAIERDFPGTTAAELSWTLTGYAIVFAALIVPLGRLADRYGRRRCFLIGLAVFTVASALCGAAPGVAVLVAARLLQAVGAAVLSATSLALLLAAFPAERRSAAIGWLMGIGGSGVALAPVIGGLLITSSWRWIFIINLPVGLACLLLGRRVLPADQKAVGQGGGGGPLPDLTGSLLLIAGIGALALAIVNAPQWGWASGRFGGCVAAAIVLTGVFLARSARHPSPVVSFSLLRIRSFATANVTALLFATCFSAMLLSFTLWTQGEWGYSSLRTGLAFLPGTLLMPPVATLTGRLVKRVDATIIFAAGCALLSAGVIWWAAMIHVHPAYLVMLLPGAVLTPVGAVIALTTVVTAATKELPPTDYATGSAITSMARQIGFVIGVSVFIAVLGTPHSAVAVVTDFRRAWAVTAATGLTAAAISVAALAYPRRRKE